MTHHQPPPSEPEFLHDGTSDAGQAGAGRPRRGKAIALGIGAVLAAGAVGAGAWAASMLSGGGPGPAEVLPASALAYASVDLDPSADQKIKAFKLLKKFPALREELDLDSQDDLRKTLVEAILEDSDCDVTYADDFEPWLGNKLGMAVLDGEKEPEPILALQTTDDDKAIDAIAHVTEACSSGDEVGVTSLDGYVLVGSSQQVVDDARTAADKKPLSEDDAFNSRLDKIGGQGIATFYVAKAAVSKLAEVAQGGIDQLGGAALGDAGSALDQLNDLVDGFEGAAATLRFSGDGVEFEAVATADGVTGEGVVSGVGDLPESTVAALGFGVGDKQLDQLVEGIGSNGLDADFEREFGISMEETVRTLLGDGLVLAVDGNTDFAGLQSGPEGLKAGLRIKGDPDKITDVLDKTLGMFGASLGQLTTESSDDAVAIGFDREYLRQLLAGGKLGSSDGFTSAVPHADKAGGVLYLDADGPNDWLVELAKAAGETDADLLENIAPLNTFGASAWTDGKDGHVLLKLTTD